MPRLSALLGHVEGPEQCLKVPTLKTTAKVEGRSGCSCVPVCVCACCSCADVNANTEAFICVGHRSFGICSRAICSKMSNQLNCRPHSGVTRASEASLAPEPQLTAPARPLSKFRRRKLSKAACLSKTIPRGSCGRCLGTRQLAFGASVFCMASTLKILPHLSVSINEKGLIEPERAIRTAKPEISA